jgi:hypothetical protein
VRLQHDDLMGNCARGGLRRFPLTASRFKGGADRQVRDTLRIWVLGQRHVVLGGPPADADVLAQPGQPLAVEQERLRLDQVASRLHRSSGTGVQVLADFDCEGGQPRVVCPRVRLAASGSGLKSGTTFMGAEISDRAAGQEALDRCGRLCGDDHGNPQEIRPVQ